MLKANPTERISADDALLDPWFADYRAKEAADAEAARNGTAKADYRIVDFSTVD